MEEGSQLNQDSNHDHTEPVDWHFITADDAKEGDSVLTDLMFDTLEHIRSSSPYILCLPNFFSMDLLINGILAVGARPAVFSDPGEVEQAIEAFARSTHAGFSMCISLGTADPSFGRLCIQALATARQPSVLWVLDPIGVGMLSYRTNLTKRLFESYAPAVLCATLMEIESIGIAVEAFSAENIANMPPMQIVRTLAVTRKLVICYLVANAAHDVSSSTAHKEEYWEAVYVTDGIVTFEIFEPSNMTSIVAGCRSLLAGIISCFLAASASDVPTIQTVAKAVTFFGMCAIQAVSACVAERGGGCHSPVSECASDCHPSALRCHLLDLLYLLDRSNINSSAVVLQLGGTDSLDDVMNSELRCHPLRIRSRETCLPEKLEVLPLASFEMWMKGGGRGLMNLGNTCFLNAVIQCLAHAPQLVPHFLTGRFQSELNTSNPLGTKGTLTFRFAEVLRRMWAPTSVAGSVISPLALVQAVMRHNAEFADGCEHDPHHVLLFILRQLHEDLNRARVRPLLIQRSDASACQSDEQLAALRWADQQMLGDSLVVNLVQGQLRTEVQCPDCGSCAISFDTFMSVPLPLPHTHELSLGLHVMPANNAPPFFLEVPTSKSDKVADLCNRTRQLTLHLKVFAPASRLVVCDVHKQCISQIFADDTPVLWIHRLTSLHIVEAYCQELSKAPLETLIPVQWRLTTGHSAANPLVAIVPGCYVTGTQIYGMVRQHILKVTAAARKGLGDCEVDDVLLQDLSQTTRCVRDVSHEYAIAEHDSLLVVLPTSLPVPPSLEQPVAQYRSEACLTLEQCVSQLCDGQLPQPPDNMWWCSRCKKRSHAIAKIRFWKLPDCLIFQLKRFQPGQVENEHEVVVPTTLTLPDSTMASSSSPAYTLFAILNREDDGHYTAVTKHPHTHKWSRFYDDEVQELEGELATCRAYLLFYTL